MQEIEEQSKLTGENLQPELLDPGDEEAWIEKYGRVNGHYPFDNVRANLEAQFGPDSDIDALWFLM